VLASMIQSFSAIAYFRIFILTLHYPGLIKLTINLKATYNVSSFKTDTCQLRNITATQVYSVAIVLNNLVAWSADKLMFCKHCTITMV
jgi:hypothetical protein